VANKGTMSDKNGKGKPVWQTHAEERKPLDASPAAITLAMLAKKRDVLEPATMGCSRVHKQQEALSSAAIALEISGPNARVAALLTLGPVARWACCLDRCVLPNEALTRPIAALPAAVTQAMICCQGADRGDGT
jgi:hypothetical protein